MISACMAGIVFAKLARPKARSNTVMFSKNAVITLVNGQLMLIFRVGNMRKSHLIEAHIRAQMIYHRKTTKEGVVLNYETEELPITTTRYKQSKMGIFLQQTFNISDDLGHSTFIPFLISFPFYSLLILFYSPLFHFVTFISIPFFFFSYLLFGLFCSIFIILQHR